MKFFVVIGNNALYTYERAGQQFKTQYIEGSNSFAINPINISEDVNSYMEILANEKNLGTTAKLEFEILEGNDSNINVAIINTFEEHVQEVHKLSDVLISVIKKLLRDRKLMIDMYGINYEGYSYVYKDNAITQACYDLLAYTIHSDDIVNLMD